MVFGSVVFLSAFLLFQVQLIVAKHLLPWFGGTPAVWTTSQMFFQLMLLAGYAYAHLLASTRDGWLQSRIHLALLLAATAAVFALVAFGGEPLLAPASLKPTGDDNPVLLLLWTLTVSIGLPFFAVSTTGPLVQRWHSRHSRSLNRTYRLYALSNVGSLLGLLSYPFGVERLLDLSQQAWLWAVLFVVFAFACGVIAWRSARYSEPFEPQHERDVIALTDDDAAVSCGGPARICAWLLLPFTSTVAFLATTNQLCQDVAAVPFLWALPLAIYLLTFIVCFDRPAWYSRRWVPMAAALTSVAVLPSATSSLRLPVQVLAYSSFLFCFCMLCHGELVRLRPGARQLTLFYLVVALGGALGGAFVSIGAPAFFPDLWELHAAIVAGWMVIWFAWWIDRTSPLQTGDRWLFAFFVTIVLWLTLRYLSERTRFGQIGLIADYSWTVTLVGGAGLGTLIGAVLWKSQIARLPYWPQALLMLVALLAGMFLLQRIGLTRSGALYADRNFYGVIRIVTTPAGSGEARQLMHGTTDHGVQIIAAGYRNTPTGYYSPSSGISVALTRLIRAGEHRGSSESGGVHLGIVGMGVGTMSVFARSGDRIRYYEINPQVIEIVQGREPYFTFVSDSAGETTIVSGDARLSLERELGERGPQKFDLLAMDAFSSDSVPVHLLTAEAFRLYAAHLKTPESILAVNVSNRYLDLEPVVAANARELGFDGVRVDSAGDPPAARESSWILLARSRRVFDPTALRLSTVRPLRNHYVTFTDKYSNLFRVLK